MAEENGAAGAQPAQAPQVKTSILTQYVRDLSFENVLAQKGLKGDAKPEMKVGVGLDIKKRPNDGEYEVAIKAKVDSKNNSDGETLFLMELDYAGIFKIEGVPQEQLHPFLMIECPRLLFPFVRRVVHDVTRDGGFPPVNVDNIDFVQMYRQQIEAAKAQAAKAPVA